MNILDVSRTTNSLQINSENANIAPHAEMTERQIQPVERHDEYIHQIQVNLENGNIARQEEILPEQEQHNQQQDEYIQSISLIRSAVYNVYDIRQNVFGQVVRNTQEEINSQNTDRVLHKVLDVLLPMGKKRLSVFLEGE